MLSPPSGKPVLLHICSPELTTAFLESAKVREKNVENISWSISMKEYCWTLQGSNRPPPDHQSDAHLIKPLMPAIIFLKSVIYIQSIWWETTVILGPTCKTKYRSNPGNILTIKLRRFPVQMILELLIWLVYANFMHIQQSKMTEMFCWQAVLCFNSIPVQNALFPFIL